MSFTFSRLRLINTTQNGKCHETHLYALALIALAFVPLSKKEQASSLRSAAIRACSVAAEKYLFHVWQLEQFTVYGTCMAKHSQRFD
jgi:hypothetical protein